jgi:hypothetical protein
MSGFFKSTSPASFMPSQIDLFDVLRIQRRPTAPQARAPRWIFGPRERPSICCEATRVLTPCVSFDQILMDELQDTNPLQWTPTCCGVAKFFAVGTSTNRFRPPRRPGRLPPLPRDRGRHGGDRRAIQFRVGGISPPSRRLPAFGRDEASPSLRAASRRSGPRSKSSGLSPATGARAWARIARRITDWRHSDVRRRGASVSASG